MLFCAVLRHPSTILRCAEPVLRCPPLFCAVLRQPRPPRLRFCGFLLLPMAILRPPLAILRFPDCFLSASVSFCCDRVWSTPILRAFRGDIYRHSGNSTPVLHILCPHRIGAILRHSGKMVEGSGGSDWSEGEGCMHAGSGGASAGDAGHLPASFAPQNCRPKVPKVDPPPAGAHARKPCEQAGRMGGRGKGNGPEGIHAGLPPHISQPFLSPSFPSPPPGPDCERPRAHAEASVMLAAEAASRRPAGGS